MPTDETIAFLKGLRVEDDAVVIGDEQVCFVMGHTGRQLSTVEVATALVMAAHEWATWAGVIEAAKKCAAARRAMHAAPKHARFAREVDLMRVKMDLDAEIAAVEEGSDAQHN